jgi:hypothetical protein
VKRVEDRRASKKFRLRLGWSARVYNDYPMIAGSRRSLSADLALVSPTDEVLVAAEFKYELCHRLRDLLRTKLPVTVWADIVRDTERVRQFVHEGKTTVAYAICIDEGNYLAQRDLSIYEERRCWSGMPRHDHEIFFSSPGGYQWPVTRCVTDSAELSCVKELHHNPVADEESVCLPRRRRKSE